MQAHFHYLGHRTGRIIACCLIALTLSLTSFALPGDGIATPVSDAFHKDFQHAEILSCNVTDKFTRLSFKMNGVVLNAFYSEDGELIAVSRNILTTQLPISLMLSIQENYPDYWVTGLFEISGRSENAYYLILENADRKLTLRSADRTRWEIYKKEKKRD